MSAQALPHRRSEPDARWGQVARWGVTVAATAVSTYALDAVATAFGFLLAASALLRDVDHTLLLGFLAGTYVLWWAGLRVNLEANWRLLEATGTSTNVLSKAAYDLVKRRTGSVRARRLASAIGYGATELAKEVPYYAGAVGAAVLSDSVSSHDAVVFLGGANLGAAVYELGLARITRAILRLRQGPSYASFDSDWVPKEYLAEYYDEVKPDELHTIAFFVDAMKQVEPGEPVLLFGVGPTLHHVFLAAGKVSEIHLADYLQANLDELERWMERDAGAHDWRAFVRYTLQCEGIASPTDEQVCEREDLTRAKITRLLRADARLADPLGEPNAGRYRTVISAYCADSATGDRATWEAYMRNIGALVRPGGVLITAALRRCRGYLVGGKPFPSADVDEGDLRAVLEPRFDCGSGSIRALDLAEHEAQGYSGIVLGWARRRAEPAAVA
jgi:hypothetical protein